MIVCKYDGTFEGFLTLIFDCYDQKLEPYTIIREGREQETFFTENITIDSDTKKAQRVWQGVLKRIDKQFLQMPFRVHLSELPGVEIFLLNFFRRLFNNEKGVENDFSDFNVLSIRKLDKKVSFEAMRMLQFVRFQKTKDEIYFATIEPQYDVIPLIVNHFKSRFADQYWLIYDIKRDYGIYYNLNEIEEITFTDKHFHPVNGKVKADMLQEEEVEYKTLWKDYFQHINIKERKNLKVQRQHMPKRYWKFLPEVTG